MDSEPASHTGAVSLTKPPSLRWLNRWIPFIVLFLAAGYGLTSALLTSSPIDPDHVMMTSIGYPQQPATFRFELTTSGNDSVASQVVVAAPYLDHLEPALIQPDGTIERLPVMLPMSVASSNQVVSEGTFTVAWKSFVTGLLVFALLLNLSIVAKLKRPGLAWLSVLTIGVIYSQLVMDGLGLWLLWPNLPELNALLSVSRPLCLIALCEFTPHFMAVNKPVARILRAFSVAAGLHLLAAPLSVPVLGQDVFLVVSAAGGA